MSTYAKISGPISKKTDAKMNSFVVIMSEDGELEMLTKQGNSSASDSTIDRIRKTVGRNMTLEQVFDRGWTYYRKEFGTVTKDSEASLRAEFPVSSKTGFEGKSAKLVTERMARVRNNALRM